MRKLFTIVLFAGALLMCPLYLYAKEITISAQSAAELALANNLSLKSEALSLSQRKRTQDTVWNSFLPSISVSSSLARPNVSFTGIPDDPITWSLSVGFSASLTLNAQLFAGIQSVVLNYQAGAIKLDQARSALDRDVRKTFFNLLLLKENLEVSGRSVDAAEKRYNQALINYQNGFASRYSMLSAKVAWENLKPGYTEMEMRYEEAVKSFKVLLGINAEDEILFEGTIEAAPINLDAGTLFDTYAARRFDIRTLANTRKSLETLNKQYYASLTPYLTLRYSMDPTFKKDPFADPWFADAENDWRQRTGNFSITLSLPLDSFIPGSKTWTSIANNKDAMRQSELALTQTLRNAEMEISNIVNRLKKSSESIAALKANVDLAEEVYMLAEEAYNAGSRELLDVQNAELEYKRAKLQAKTEEYMYITALLDLEYALNTPVKELGVAP